MYFKQILLNIILILLLSSCTYIPVTVDNKKDQCEMVSKKFELSVTDIKGIRCHGGEDCLLMLVTVPLGSLIISGSIVLIGNTIHWLEYQSTCDEGFLRKSIYKLKH